MERIYGSGAILVIGLVLFIARRMMASAPAEKEEEYSIISTLKVDEAVLAKLYLKAGQPLLLECGTEFNTNLLVRTTPYATAILGTVTDVEIQQKTAQRRSTAVILRIDGTIVTIGFRYV